VLFETGDPQNTLGYSSGAYDELLAASRSATEVTTRMELLGRAEARLLEDVPVIPVFFRVSKRLVRPDLRGVSANPLGHVASRYLSFAAE
jgi:oligopeptide transport system substrate-binding protein